MTNEIPLHKYLPESLQEYQEEIQDLTSYYEDYLNTLIEYGEMSFSEYLKMEDRDDLLEIKGEIGSTGISLEYCVDTELVVYLKSDDGASCFNGKTRVVLKHD